MTAGLQAAVVAQQSEKLVSTKGELCSSPEADAMYKMNERLRKIEAKERCLRVQFLDWLSDKLLDWSNRVHVTSNKIDSPCLIEVEPRKKEDSKSAKENKEIDRLYRLLKEERERNDKLREEQSKMIIANIEEVSKILEKVETK